MKDFYMQKLYFNLTAISFFLHQNAFEPFLLQCNFGICDLNMILSYNFFSVTVILLFFYHEV